MRAPVRVLIVVWLVVLCALGALGTRAAHAQDTGGSIGGGSWDEDSSSDTSSSSGDTSYSSSGGTSYDYSSGGSSGSTGGGSGLGGAGVVVLLVLAGIGGLIWLVVSQASRTSMVDSAVDDVQGAGIPGRMVDVTVLRFGLDARVRPYVQKELDRIARVADTKTAAGLVKTLNEVALMLRRIRDAWVYGGAENEAMSPQGDARATFQRHVSDARATFAHETVRAADGALTTADAPHHTILTEEGPGLVLVTLVIAARQELFTVQHIGTGDDLRAALEVLSALTAQTLVAMEIVWTPSDPDDRMSSVELEARLPDLVFPIRGAMVGKVICSYCGGPFPQELMSCPHCGAPARAAAPAAG